MTSPYPILNVTPSASEKCTNAFHVGENIYINFSLLQGKTKMAAISFLL